MPYNKCEPNCLRVNCMGFFRNLGRRISSGMRRFMQGRYGNDKLNTALLICGAIISILSLILRNPWFSLFSLIICYFLMFVVIFRMLSRNTYKRYRENRKYLQFKERIRDRQHRYYDCPRCRQQVRVPRGKGKISITCPKCKEKFIKKT